MYYNILKKIMSSDEIFKFIEYVKNKFPEDKIETIKVLLEDTIQ